MAFERGLKQWYAVVEVTRATFIKPRNQTAKALMVKFRGDSWPEYIKEAGEHQLTKVYAYKDKPLQCHKCQKYGHDTKRCSADDYTCGTCAASHRTEQCTSSELKCSNCAEQHSAIDANCKIRQKEDKVLDIQKRNKVGKRMARDILEGRHKVGQYVEDQRYERYIQIKSDRDATRTICPFEVQKCLNNELDLLEEDVQAVREGYTVKAKSEQQFRKVMQLKAILGIPCAAAEDSPAVGMYNSARGLVYINEYDVTDTAGFEEGLKRNSRILD